MEYIVVKEVPEIELGPYGSYVGYLFRNQYLEYNICNNTDEIVASNKYKKFNIPQYTIVVSDDEICVGDKFLAICDNIQLKGKTFKYIGKSEKNNDSINVKDKDGTNHVIVKTILNDSYKVIRNANRSDLEKIINNTVEPIIN